MICYAALFVLFAGFGGLLYAQSSGLNDLAIPWNQKECDKATNICTFTIKPSVDLVKPKLYYKLDNFFSNHRNFVKSRYYNQLRGKTGLTQAQVDSNCDN